MAVMTKALLGSCSFQVAGEHVLFAVSEEDISGLGTATVKNVWSVNVRDRKSTRLNSSHTTVSRMPSSA